MELPKGMKDRLGHPIIAGFIISWILFNWQFILFMLFARYDIEQKLFCASSNYLSWSKGFCWPLLTSTVLSIILPWITAGFEWVASYPKTQMKLILVDRDIELAKKKNDLANLMNSLETVEQLQEKLDIKNRDISRLQQELAKTDRTIEPTIKLLRQLEIEGESCRDELKKTNVTDEALNFVKVNIDKIVTFLSKHHTAKYDESKREELRHFFVEHSGLFSDMKRLGLFDFGRRQPWQVEIPNDLRLFIATVIAEKSAECRRELEATGYRNRQY